MKYIKYIFGISLIIISSQSLANRQPINNQKMTEFEFADSLEQGFEQIIKYHIKKGELHQRSEKDVRSFVAYLLAQTDYTKKRLSEIIKKINYETFKPDEKYNVWPELEFWRGMGEYGSTAALNYDGGVFSLDDEDPIVVGRYDNYKTPSDAERLKISKDRNAIKMDLEKYPISLHGYYEYKFNETALFYAWIGYLWQEIEGYKCGIKVRTIQNNSIATFSLNDYLEDDFSSFMESDYGDKPQRLNNFFPRKLGLIELYLRASQTGYPFNPYKSYWRYFEKEDEFMEIVTYEFTTGLRSGKKATRNTASVNQIIKHKNTGVALKHITEFTNQKIFDGWQEKLRPLDMPKRMHGTAFEFDIWTGVNWSKEQTNILPEQRVKKFEEQFKIQLPSSFFHYLRLLNGRQYNSYNRFFPIDNLYTVLLKKFYTIDELENVSKESLLKDPNHLWIGELENKKMLGIIINKQSDKFGRVVLAENGVIEICDYSFDKFAKYAQGAPVQPEIYAAEKNDAEFLTKRIKEGWDFNKSYSYQNAITQAAEKNSHEALEVLLKAGARLRHNKHRTMTGTYDKRTMEILDQYQKDE